MLRTRTPPHDAVAAAARELPHDARRHDDLLDRIGDARLVLLGEATHGTREFYAERAAISRRLIEERGFDGVAVEADWPDAERVHCFARGVGGDATPEEALRGFQRFPAWMWRNREVEALAGWLRDRNDGLPPERHAGFWGLDLYSLFGSIQAVVRYLQRVDPEAAERAERRFACFDRFAEDTSDYGYAAHHELVEPCEEDVVRQLLELQQAAPRYASRDGLPAADAQFSAERNARVVLGAERYYRAMFRGGAASWNLRDRHMMETLEALLEHLQAQGRSGKVAVWAHNSHLGDARATDFARRRQLNLGQLVRERFGDDAVLVGFATHTGTVTAASSWDGPAELKVVRPSLPESWERQLHDHAPPQAYLPLRARGEDASDSPLTERLLERAIGVIYLPETERISHYFDARLARQFDALLWFDETSAVEPLDD